MELYWSAASPYARKCCVTLIEAGLEGKVKLVGAMGSPLDASGMPVAHNPLGKLPVLVRDDGCALYDSRVICRYLDSLGGGRLYPAPPSLWETLTLEATADGITDAAILMVYESRIRPEEIRFAPWVEGQWAKAARALDTLEARWTGHLAGPFDMGQIALACTLGYLDLRFSDRDWRAGRPALAAWFAQISERPSLAATAPPG